MLTVYSPFCIENHASASLVFEVHLFSAPHLRGRSPTSTIPSVGALLPNLQCYLPTPAIWYYPDISHSADDIIPWWPALLVQICPFPA